MMTKQDIRRQMRQQKTQYQSQFPEWSQEICCQIRQMPQWQEARTVLLYAALPDEPSLQPLFDDCLLHNRRILLPVVVGDDLVLKPFTNNLDLREGAFHILEPTGPDFPLDHYADIDFAAIPGVAFDASGHRLGRGRGYYDRLLPRIPHAYTVGICFPFQFLPVVPSEPHDIPVNTLIV